jgi:hypothetical protein
MTNDNQEIQQRQDELIDELIARTGHGREAILGQNGLVAHLTKRITVQRNTVQFQQPAATTKLGGTGDCKIHSSRPAKCV